MECGVERNKDAQNRKNDNEKRIPFIKFFIKFQSSPNRYQDDRDHFKSHSGISDVFLRSGIFTFLFVLLVLG